MAARDQTPDEVTYNDLRKAGRVNLGGLERFARALGVELPHMPRTWSGYRRALVKRVARRLDILPKVGWD